MEQTAGDTMREMQFLLLALRPVALDEVGLASAIEGVCHAYAERLGVGVRAELEPVAFCPPRSSMPCSGSPRKRWPTPSGTAKRT